MSYTRVQFIGGVDAALQPAFQDASSFWNAVVRSGARDTFFAQTTSIERSCGVAATINAGSTLSGLTVLASTPFIDGAGSVLGRAGPCLFDTNNANTALPIVGIMEFDSADSFSLLRRGEFEAVIVHEMGHVIGVGTVWSFRGLVSNPCVGNQGNTGRCNPTYNGAGGISGYAAIGGPRNTRVPVANTGGGGTANGHWRESTFDNELMTGFLNSGRNNPLSVMSIRSLTDMGYSVNENAQESYTLPRVAALEDEESIEMFGDTLFFNFMSAEELQAIDGVVEADYSGEFAGIFAIMILGFFALGALMFTLNRSQKKAIENMQMESGVVTKSPMHLNISA